MNHNLELSLILPNSFRTADSARRCHVESRGLTSNLSLADGRLMRDSVCYIGDTSMLLLHVGILPNLGFGPTSQNKFHFHERGDIESTFYVRSTYYVILC